MLKIKKYKTMLKSISGLLPLIFVIFQAEKATAYPTMVMHGYATCMTCHFSPSGGGALTNYGKFIAGELLGRYNDSSNALKWLRNPTVEDKFEKKFFGKDVDWILGLQGRGVQTLIDAPTIKRGNTYLMQFDLEAGLSVEKFFAVAQFGPRGAQIAEGQSSYDLDVRQYYAGVRDTNYAFRAGKFFPEFGIRYPNHNVPTRKGLFFNHNEEPKVAQYSYYTDNMDFNVGYLEGSEATRLTDKKGYVGTVTYRTGNTRTGFSMLDADGLDSSGFKARSVFTAIGYQEKGYTLAEYATLVSKVSGQDDRQTNLVFAETGWEVTKGIIPYLGYQKTSANTTTEAVPVGLKLHLYTHFELQLEHAIQYFNANGVNTKGTAQLAMLHIYF